MAIIYQTIKRVAFLGAPDIKEIKPKIRDYRIIKIQACAIYSHSADKAEDFDVKCDPPSHCLNNDLLIARANRTPHLQNEYSFSVHVMISDDE